MTPDARNERTVGGLAGKAIGRVKEVLGTVGEDDHLTREVVAQQRLALIARDRAGAEHQADAQAANERAAADTHQAGERVAADRSVEDA